MPRYSAQFQFGWSGTRNNISSEHTQIPQLAFISSHVLLNSAPSSNTATPIQLIVSPERHLSNNNASLQPQVQYSGFSRLKFVGIDRCLLTDPRVLDRSLELRVRFIGMVLRGDWRILQSQLSTPDPKHVICWEEAGSGSKIRTIAVMLSARQLK